MTKEEYVKKLQTLKTNYDSRVKNLQIDYIAKNNPHRSGGVVTDHLGSIIIDKIFADLYSLCAVHQGRELKKDGTVKKNNKVRQVYQSNLA